MTESTSNLDCYIDVNNLPPFKLYNAANWVFTLKTITFHPWHPFTVSMLKAGLITLLGKYRKAEDEEKMHWYWSGVTLQYWLKTSLAGSRDVVFTKPNKAVEDVVEGWSEGIRPMDETGTIYRDGIAEISFPAFDFPLTFDMLKAGFTTLLGYSPTISSSKYGVKDIVWAPHVYITATTNEAGKISKPIRVRVDMKREDILRVVTAWRFQS